VAGEPVKPSPSINSSTSTKSFPSAKPSTSHVENKTVYFQGVQRDTLSAQKSYILSISQHLSPGSQDSSTSVTSSPPSSFCYPPPPPSSSSASPIPKSHPLFATEYFEVRASQKGGYGAFAIKDISKDTIIITEKALFSGTTIDVFHMFEQLAREQRDEYMNLHAHNGFGTHKILSIFKTNR
jgi:hypothetical protein